LESNQSNKLEQQLENLGRQKWEGHEYLNFCLLVRNLKQAAFDAGREWEKERENGGMTNGYVANR